MKMSELELVYKKRTTHYFLFWFLENFSSRVSVLEAFDPLLNENESGKLKMFLPTSPFY